MNSSYKIRHNREIVMIFIALALAFFIFLGGLIAYNNNLFRARVPFYTLIENAYGLKSLPPIYFKGFVIGKVKSFQLTQENQIRVNFYIFKDYHDKILKYSAITINTNVLSGEVMEFQVITPDPLKVNEGTIEKNGFIPYINSPLAQKYIKSGKLIYEPAGIEGVLEKSNQILKVFIEQKTSDKIDAIISSTAQTMSSIKGTVKSFEPHEKNERSRQIVNTLDKVNKTMNSIAETANYVKETIEVVHSNRKEFAPLMINTNKTLEKASNTLDGLNNNPLIKGGIPKERKVYGAEIVQ